MKNTILFILILSLQTVFCQNRNHTFSELEGLEDTSGNTHLFYKMQGYGMEGNYEWTENSIYHYDIKNNTDSLFFFVGGGCYSGFFCNYSGVDDIVFWNNDPTKFIYAGYSCGIDCVGDITRFDEEYPSLSVLNGGITLFISKQNDSLIYANYDFSGNFKSTDGGKNWKEFLQDYKIISVNPFNDSIFYCLNRGRELVYTTDGGNNFSLSDTSSFFGDRIFYDADKQHVYLINKNYIRVSNINEVQNSWRTIYTSPEYMSLYPDSIPGNIFIFQGKNIYLSEFFGANFRLYKSLDKSIISIYKKPYSETLFACTKYHIYKITPDTIITIKQLSAPKEYYPLEVGNKWAYKGEYNDWIWPYSLKVTREVTDKVILDNGKEYFEIKEDGDKYDFKNTFYERIDSVTGRIYRYNKDSVNTDYEYLIDDLKSEAGDTIKSFRFVADQLGDQYQYPRFVSEKGNILFNHSTDIRNFQFGVLLTWSYSLAKNFGLIYVSSGDDNRFFHYSVVAAKINGIIYGDKTLVDVEKQDELPTNFALSQNYPNPFNPTTTIRYTIPASLNPSKGGTLVTLKVFDLLGREVAVLVNEEKPVGEYKVEWNAEGLASGVYFYRITAGSYSQSMKMMLMK